MAFNPNEHLMPLKGKQYLQVMWRIAWLRDEHPDWSISTDMIRYDAEKNHAIFRATLSDADGKVVSTGYGSESAKDFGDFIEKAETKAIGRTLALAGYGTQFTGDELDEGERIVDSPVEQKPRKTAKKAQEQPKPQEQATAPVQEEKPQEEQPFALKVAMPDEVHVCELCGKPLEYVKKNGEVWLEQAEYSKKRFGHIFCRSCMAMTMKGGK